MVSRFGFLGPPTTWCAQVVARLAFADRVFLLMGKPPFFGNSLGILLSGCFEQTKAKCADLFFPPPCLQWEECRQASGCFSGDCNVYVRQLRYMWQIGVEPLGGMVRCGAPRWIGRGSSWVTPQTAAGTWYYAENWNEVALPCNGPYIHSGPQIDRLGSHTCLVGIYFYT